MRWRHVIVTAVVLVLVAATPVLVAAPVVVPSDSMAPTLHKGDHLLLLKLGDGEPRRGDIVAFTAPGSEETLVKRVVGVGGDEIGIEDGLLVVNSRRVPEPHIDHDLQDGVFFGPVRVPPGTVFLLGDNRRDAQDSREFGAVDTDRVKGRIVLRLWPHPGGL